MQHNTDHAAVNGRHASERYAEHVAARRHDLTDKEELELERGHVTEKEHEVEAGHFFFYRSRLITIGKKTFVELLAEVAFDAFIIGLVWLLRELLHLHFTP